MKDAAVLSSRKIGQMVRQRRLANNLTQRQLGELAGVGLRLVSELERGKTDAPHGRRESSACGVRFDAWPRGGT